MVIADHHHCNPASLSATTTAIMMSSSTMISKSHHQQDDLITASTAAPACDQQRAVGEVGEAEATSVHHHHSTTSTIIDRMGGDDDDDHDDHRAHHHHRSFINKTLSILEDEGVVINDDDDDDDINIEDYLFQSSSADDDDDDGELGLMMRMDLSSPLPSPITVPQQEQEVQQEEEEVPTEINVHSCSSHSPPFSQEEEQHQEQEEQSSSLLTTAADAALNIPQVSSHDECSSSYSSSCGSSTENMEPERKRRAITTWTNISSSEDGSSLSALRESPTFVRPSSPFLDDDITAVASAATTASFTATPATIKKKKRVRFADRDRVMYVPHVDDIPRDVFDRCWMTKHEYAFTRKRSLKLIDMMDRQDAKRKLFDMIQRNDANMKNYKGGWNYGKVNTAADDVLHIKQKQQRQTQQKNNKTNRGGERLVVVCVRGLRELTHERVEEREKQKRLQHRAVFRVQYQQKARTAKMMTLLSTDGGNRKDEAIRQASRKYTKRASKFARFVGITDAVNVSSRKELILDRNNDVSKNTYDFKYLL